MLLSSAAARALAPADTAALWQVAGKVERCVETGGRAGFQQEAPQQGATWRPTSGWRSSWSSPGSCPAMHPRPGAAR
jgi:hypothetical protein